MVFLQEEGLLKAIVEGMLLALSIQTAWRLLLLSEMVRFSVTGDWEGVAWAFTQTIYSAWAFTQTQTIVSQ